MPQVTIRVTENVTTTLGRLRVAAARALRPVAGPLADAVRDFWRRHLESAGALGGTGPWPVLSLATIRRWGAHPPLLHTGALWTALTAGGSVLGEGRATSRTYGYAVLSEDGTRLTVGATAPVLNLLTGGTRRMPARDPGVAEVPPDEVERWAALVADGLQDVIDGGGRP